MYELRVEGMTTALLEVELHEAAEAVDHGQPSAEVAGVIIAIELARRASRAA